MHSSVMQAILCCMCEGKRFHNWLLGEAAWGEGYGTQTLAAASSN